MPRKKPTPAEPPLGERTQPHRDRVDERIAGFREELRSALGEATQLLATAPDTSSKAWFEFSERLQDACWNLATATYCLSEWPEPDDLQAGINRPAITGHRERRGALRWSRR